MLHYPDISMLFTKVTVGLLTTAKGSPAKKFIYGLSNKQVGF